MERAKFQRLGPEKFQFETKYFALRYIHNSISWFNLKTGKADFLENCNGMCPLSKRSWNWHRCSVSFQIISKAGNRRLARSLRNMFATWKHARNKMCVEVYSCCYGHFTRQISHVSRFEQFHARSGKITISKGFSCKKIFNEKIVRTADCM